VRFGLRSVETALRRSGVPARMVRKTALVAVALGLVAYGLLINSNGEPVEITLEDGA